MMLGVSSHWHGETRVRLLALLLAASLCLTATGCQALYDSLGGRFRGGPEELGLAVSPRALHLIDQAVRGIDPGRFTDHHVHLLTRDVHPRWRDPLRFIDYGRFQVYLSASGVPPHSDDLEGDYLRRLVALAEHMPAPPRMLLYAMDHTYHRDGTIDRARTQFHVPNDKVHLTAQQRPDLFVPVVSIHPYRPDALDQLDHWARRGVRYVKWLPNSMDFDPSEARLAPFYRRMAALNMVLLSHTGDERALTAWDQHLGNPQLLRQALDMGVTVVALHAASKSKAPDLDHPHQRKTPCFDLFLRMMDDPRYDGLLYGEISTVTFAGHLPRPLRTLLARTDLHHRLINGSDYPLCAVRAAICLRDLQCAGFITAKESRLLREIYAYNPLLFDFVLKRTVRHPETGARFADAVFMSPDALP